MKTILEKLNINNWSKELLDLSIPTEFFKLNHRESMALSYAMQLVFDGFGNCVENLINPINERLKKEYEDWINQGIFLKVYSRSPKDAYNIRKKDFKYTSLEDIWGAIFDSERIYDDICRTHPAQDLYFILRKWVELPKESEFRCFIRDKKLIAASQYFYQDYFEIDQQDKDKINTHLVSYINEIIPLLPLDDLIVDVSINGLLNTILIELNPYECTTDPCLYSWEEVKEIQEYTGIKWVTEPILQEESLGIFDIFNSVG